MIFTYLMGMMVGGGLTPGVTPEPMVKCTVSCTRGVEYGVEVAVCIYDEKPRCDRFQPVCKDEGLTVCKPRVVNLGRFNPESMYYTPATYRDLTAPATGPYPAPSRD